MQTAEVFVVERKAVGHRCYGNISLLLKIRNEDKEFRVCI
jgi:transcriptional regulator of NAD metabolism